MFIYDHTIMALCTTQSEYKLVIFSPQWPDFFDSKVVADLSSLSDSIFFDNAVLGLKTRCCNYVFHAV